MNGLNFHSSEQIFYFLLVNHFDQNLKYLTMVDMLYFNCAWMMDIPQDIVLNFDECSSTMDLSSTSKGEIINLSL